MPTYKLTIAYDGARYSGWQIQPNAVTVQETLAQAMAVLLRAPVTLIGAGRTDAGVHALGQVAHFRWPELIDDLPRHLLSINGLLPWDIRVLAWDLAPDGFHAQISACGKEYHYCLTLDDVQLPFERGSSWHMRRPLDRALMREAAARFVGTHDFTSYANVGSSSVNPVRCIMRLDVVDTPSGIRLEFEGNGFLYKMVRNITGMLVAVATGKRPLGDIDRIFAAKDRRAAPMGAPAHGLTMLRVDYPDSAV